MNPLQVAELMAALGITGIDPTKMSLIMTLAQQIGSQVKVDSEELQAYYPQTDESLYMPTNVPKNFYYDSKGLRNAGKVGDMRSLTTPNLDRLRELGRLGK